MRVPIQIEHLVASAASVWLQTQDSDAEGTNIHADLGNTGKPWHLVAVGITGLVLAWAMREHE